MIIGQSIRQSIIPIIICGIIFVAIQYGVAIKNDTSLEQLAGPDAYMRLNRVQLLEDEGHWFNSLYPRVNPPVGHEQHWTRPMDSIIWVGAKILEPYTGFKIALHQVGLWINIVFMSFALCFLIVIFRLENRKQTDQIFMLGLVFVTQLGIHSAFALGRPDHQSLLAVLQALSMLLTACILIRSSLTILILSGFVSALAVWVSVESLLIVAINLLIIGLAWLCGNIPVARRAKIYAFSMLIFSLVFIALERGDRFIAPIYTDQLSMVYALIYLLITFFWLILDGCSSRALIRKSIMGRLSAGVLLAAVACVILYAIVPSFFSGPLNNVNTLYEQVRLTNIEEYQQLVVFSELKGTDGIYAVSRMLSYLGIAIVAFFVTLIAMYRNSGLDRFIQLYFCLGIIVFTMMSIWQIHWVQYAVLFAIVPYAKFALSLLNRMSFRSESIGSAALNVASLIMILGWPLVPLLVSTSTPVMANNTQVVQEDSEEGVQCNVADVSAFLNSNEVPEKSKIMAFVDFGPELLYRTTHSVYSIPNHRYQPGFNSSFNFMTASTNENARSIATSLKIDFVLVCFDQMVSDYYSQSDNSTTLYRRLRDSKVPEWMSPVQLTDNLTNSFQLYEVEPDEL